MKFGINRCFSRMKNRTSCIWYSAACCLLLFAVAELFRAVSYLSVQQIIFRKRFQTENSSKDVRLDPSTTVSGLCVPPELTADNFRYRPRPEANYSEVGEVLETAVFYNTFLDKPLRSAIELTPDVAEDFIFVTATDKKYFHIAMDAIGNVQKLFPNRSILFYDLDENKSSSDISKIKQLCGVIYRKFNFTKYPKHVRSLYSYAWKPLLITEVLSEYPALFFIDSSVRFISSNFTMVFTQAIENGGIVTFGYAGHTIFPTTHSGMYRYLPIPRARAIDVPMRESGHIYVARNRDIYANVVRWWAACALVELCIAPTMKRSCKIRAANVFADCHRFDQSALNILLANHFVYDVRAYSYLNPSQSCNATITEVRRGSAHKENVSVCLPNGQKKFSKSKQFFG